MGFLDMMKKAMGFSSADDDEMEVEGIDATVTPLRRRALPAAQDETDREASAADKSRESGEDSSRVSCGTMTAVEPARPDASSIFDGVLEVFNSALPGFLQKSVDPARQRQLLFDALDSSMKDYFEHLEKNVERRLHARYQSDSHKLQEQIEELRQKARKEEEGNSNAKNLQLSAERQKRALSERVHELEKQLASIEAENEQYILENKTMANKLRLAAMSDRDVDSVSQEIAEREAALAQRETSLTEREAGIARLEADLKAREDDVMEKEANAGDVSPEMESRLAEADRKLSESESRLASAQDTLKAYELKIAELTASVASTAADSDKTSELEKEISVMRDSLEQAKAKDELSRAMVNDLNGRVSEARAAAQDMEAKYAASQAELKEASDQLALVTARLTKAQEDLKVVREVQQQVMKLEESQRINDAELRRQKDELMEKDEIIRAKDADILTKNTTLRIKDETIRRLEDQTDSLRKAVETAQFDKTQAESALRTEIERLKSLKGIAVPADPEPVKTDDEIEIPVETGAEPELDLTLDLPELVTPKVETAVTPKPRRGRPPKPRPAVEPEAPKKDPAKNEEEDNDFSLLDSTDWLIATPAPEAAPRPKRQRKQKSESQDDAFGYKEPVRQEPPDNPAQMLLW